MEIAKDLYTRPDERKKFQELIEPTGQLVNYDPSAWFGAVERER